MTRRDVVLAVLSVANGVPHTPVQVQKLFFLLDENIAADLGRKQFDFKPCDYGPFDKAVYEELESLAIEGLVDIRPKSTWETYTLSTKGQEAGENFLRELPPRTQDYINRASAFVRSLSFTELVSSIYKAYPHMRVNSIFQG